MVILQDFGTYNGYLERYWRNKWSSCKIVAKWMVILQYSGWTNGYLARHWQNKWLYCKSLAEWIVIFHKILSEWTISCKNLFVWMVILQASWRMNGYLASFWQNEWLSCTILAECKAILQDSDRINCYISQNSIRMNNILQDSVCVNGYLASFLENEWLSCKFLAEWMVILHGSGWMRGYLARFWQN